MTTCRVKTSGQYARLFSFFSYTHTERERTQSHDQKFSSEFISFFFSYFRIDTEMEEVKIEREQRKKGKKTRDPIKRCIG
jgi:hypothetical protein